METRLLELLEQKDLFYADIAEVISEEFSIEITKNACIGKGRRLQVPARLPHRKRPCKRASTEPSLNGSQPSGRWGSKRKLRANPLRKRFRARPRPRSPLLPLTILQLRPSSCRWPIGHSPPYEYCGRHKLDGSSYCLEHAKIATPGLFRR